MLDWRASIASLGRVILITPGTPQERVDHLRKALARDPARPGLHRRDEEVQSRGRLSQRREVEATVEHAMTTLDDKGLAEMKDIALNRYYH